MGKTLVDTLTVKQDVGSYEPVYKKAILEFWSDGSVTWKPRGPKEDSNAEVEDALPNNNSYVGDSETL